MDYASQYVILKTITPLDTWKISTFKWEHLILLDLYFTLDARVTVNLTWEPNRVHEVLILAEVRAGIR